MFKIGDTVIYSAHGLCKIDDICEKTIAGVTRTYYVLHPLAQSNLTISTPVDNKNVIHEMMGEEEAQDLLQSFKERGVKWIQDVKPRNAKYNQIVKSGNRRGIAGIANTLMLKSIEAKMNKKKLFSQDREMLDTIQDILFKEMALALNSSYEEIAEQAEEMVSDQLDLSQHEVVQ